MTDKAMAAIVEGAFADQITQGQRVEPPVRSRVQSLATSAAATPAASGAEDKGTPAAPGVKKKKLTRYQVKGSRGAEEAEETALATICLQGSYGNTLECVQEHHKNLLRSGNEIVADKV